jgi:hypothetical protein
MSKDPAINWYFDNWTGGTFGMSRFHKGCYMDLLSAQYHIGPLSLEQIKNILGNDFPAWQILKEKFVQDENKNFLNERLAAEVRKRKENSLKQSERAKKRWEENNGICRGIYNGIATAMPFNEIGIGTLSLGKSENLFFQLTDFETNEAGEYIHLVRQKELTPSEIKNFFSAFKIQYSGGSYFSRDKVTQHFKDWLKKQDLNKPVKAAETFERRKF